MKLTNAVRTAAEAVLENERLREELLEKARKALHETLDLRQRDAGVLEEILKRTEIEVFWSDPVGLQARLEYAPGTWSPPLPGYCELPAGAVATIEDTLASTSVHVAMPSVRNDDLLMTRPEGVREVVTRLYEARKLNEELGLLSVEELSVVKQALSSLLESLRRVQGEGSMP